MSAPPRRLLLLGAGHANTEVLRRFGQRPEPGVRVTVLTRATHSLYSGMLPGVIAGDYRANEARIDISTLAEACGVSLACDAATGIDIARRKVFCASGKTIDYDVLSIDIGAATNIFDTPGATDHAIAVKPLDAFLSRIDVMRGDIGARESNRIAIVGGGAGGVELAFALERAMRVPLVLYTATPEILPDYPATFRDRVLRACARRGIAVRTNARVSRVDKNVLQFADGMRASFDHLIWATPVTPASWLRETGLALSPNGFLRVDQTLRVIDQSDIFAAGDVIAFEPPLPKSGVYAVRQGPVLAASLRARLRGETLRPFRPQKHRLILLSLSDGSAIGTRNGLVVAGRWVWRWKRWLDRRFVARYAANTVSASRAQ